FACAFEMSPSLIQINVRQNNIVVIAKYTRGVRINRKTLVHHTILRRAVVGKFHNKKTCINGSFKMFLGIDSEDSSGDNRVLTAPGGQENLPRDRRFAEYCHHPCSTTEAF